MKSWGRYTDNINAVYGGEAILLGFNNYSLMEALADQRGQGDRPDGMGRRFEAFVIPTSAPSVRKE